MDQKNNSNSPFSFGQQNNNPSSPFNAAPNTNIFNAGAQQPEALNSIGQNQAFGNTANQPQPGAFGVPPQQPMTSNFFSSSQSQIPTQTAAQATTSFVTAPTTNPFQNYQQPVTAPQQFTSAPQQSSIPPQQVTSSVQPTAQPSLNKQITDPINLKTTVDSIKTPLGFGQKIFSEIIEDIKNNLEEDVKNFKKIAQDVFQTNEKIIRARNNYSTTLKLIEMEENKLKELDENIEIFNEYLKNTRKEFNLQETSNVKKDQLLECIYEIETLYDEFNSLVTEIKDEEDEIMALINENMSVIKELDNDLNKLELKD